MSTIILILTFSLFNFSPHTVEAMENEEIEEQEEEVSQEDANEDTDQESEVLQEDLSDHPNNHDEQVQNDKDLKTSNEPKLFTQGDSGDHVIELKGNLTLVGFGNYPSRPSKKYGSVTEGVVKDFQTDNNLPVDGIAGKSTLAKIEELLTKPSDYTIGDSGDHVVELKKNLRLLGFGDCPSNPSKNYGSVTEGVVKDFQTDNNLPVDGVAGKSTLAKIEGLLTKPSDYTIGDSGDHVVELKKNLRLLGFGDFPSNPSKNYGSVTEGVVKDFQTDNNLPVDGVAGKSTFAKIEELLTKPSDYTIGDSGDHVVELKKNLRLLGFGDFPSNPSKNYGSVTEGVVKDLQTDNNVPVDGIAGKSSLAKIEKLLTKPSDYTIGDSGEHVVELKKNLRLLGFGDFPSNPSKNYGSVTEGVVKDFQTDNNLPVDGVAGKSTLAKIEELLTKPSDYTIGDSGEHVVELKKNLRLLGFGDFPSNPSKNYGSVTEGVVKDFQTDNNLPVDGVAGKSTFAKIEELLTKPSDYTIGDSGDHVVELKKNLRLLGFGDFPSNPSKNYGSVTEGVVKDFQTDNNLPVDGVAGKSTLAKIEGLLTKPSDYTIGDSGDHVVELKKNLRLLGFGDFPSNPSKNYGSVTEGVVKDFQTDNNLPVDGVAGKSTLAKIEELLTKPSDYTIGDSGDHVVELKKNLTLLGFGNFPSSPSKNYGNVTEGVVKDFQTDNNLPVDGVACKSTLAKIEELLTKPSDYTIGDSGDHIVELKKNLTLLGPGNFPSSPSKNYGSVTEGVVKDFQLYYGLKATGNGDKKTLNKIESLLSSSYQNGERGTHVVKLKEDLTRLGFVFPKNPSTGYGDVTEKRVREFQKYYGLTINGIADEQTLAKIESLLSSSYQNGERGTHVVKLKEDLTRLGFVFPKNPSTGYGDVTEKRVREFQKYYGLTINGIADEKTLAKIESLLSSSYQNGERGTHVVKLKEDLTRLGFVFPKNPSTGYGDVTEKRVREFQKYYGLTINGIADEKTLAKIESLLSSSYQNGERGTHVV